MNKYTKVKRRLINIITAIKKLTIFLRTSFKLIVILVIAISVVFGIIWSIYKPIYAVSLDGELIGYCKNKSELQKKLNKYINGEELNVAFVQIDNLPEYDVCFQNKNISTTDEEIFEKIKGTGVTYYKYYAMLKNGEEVLYLPTYEEAEKTIEDIKQKPGYEIQNIGFVQKYETSLPEFSNVETAIAKLYIPPVETRLTVAKTSKTNKYSSGAVDTAKKTNSGSKVEIAVKLSRPVSGTITSRFGGRRSGTHTGLDIATSKGTPIKAAAGGTVTFSGYKGSYGKMIVVSHGDGVQTYYAHCDELLASVGNTIYEGDVIAKVGSTGNSTGSHLHLEVRIKGVAQNPQNYVY